MPDALFRYDHDANQRTLEALRATAAPPPRAVALFAHLLAAQRVWVERMRTGASATPVWPDLTLDDCAAWLDENRALLDGFLSSREGADRQASGERVFRYRTTRGVGYESTAGEVLQHLLLHGAYHRGQIAAAVREAGGTPPVTDYVMLTRRET